MANEIIRGMGTSHTAVAAVDFEKSLKFYAALGIKCFTQWGGEGNRIALLDVGDGTRIELFEKPELTAGEAALLHLAFSVQNVDEAYAAALRAGAVSLRAPGGAAPGCQALPHHPARRLCPGTCRGGAGILQADRRKIRLIPHTNQYAIRERGKLS